MQIPSAGETVTLDQCGAIAVPIHQWTAPDGTLRGVKVKALTFKAEMLAEQKATGKDGAVNAYRLVAEEVVAGIYDPPGLTVDHILNWNAEVVYTIHQRIKSLGGVAASLLAAELARLAAGPPPEPGAAPGRRDAPDADVGGGALPGEGAAADEPPPAQPG